MTFDQSVFDFNIPMAMGGEDFIISPSNREAVEWMANQENWPVPVLIVYGPTASGKSHLCHIWQETHQAKEVSANILGNEEKIVELVKPQDMYFIDDIDQILTKHPAYQKNLFHLYNLLFNQGGRLLLTSKVSPKEISIDLPDLSSRLLGAPAVEIKDPDDATLQALLLKLFDDRQILIKPDVIKFLLPRMGRSYEEMRHTVKGLDALSLKGKRPITVPLIRQWFEGEGKDRQKTLFS